MHVHDKHEEDYLYRTVTTSPVVKKFQIFLICRIQHTGMTSECINALAEKGKTILILQ
jgi:hypothetical protein